jgi:cell division septation protein DedD
LASNDQDFQDELEQEIEKGMAHSEENSESFTVRVKDEEYIVKRRYADRDKARGAADDLRKTNLNVDDDTDGSFHEPASDMDEKTDWSILVNTSNDLEIPKNAENAQPPPELPSKKKLKVVFPAALFFVVVAVTAFFMFKPDNAPELYEHNKYQTAESKVRETHAVESPAVNSGKKESGTDQEMPLSETQPEQTPITWDKNDSDNSTDIVQGDTPDSSTDNPPGDLPVNQPEDAPDDDTSHTADSNDFTQPAIQNATAGANTNAKASPPVIQKAAITQPVLSFPFTIHLSSYQDRKAAEEEVARLHKKQYDAFSVYVAIPGKGVWYRTFTGYYQTIPQAQKVLGDLKKEFSLYGRVMKTPYALQIGAIDTRENLSAAATLIKSKGYSCYFARAYDDSDKVRLLAGAYITEKGVVELQEFMMKDGIQAQIVRR